MAAAGSDFNNNEKKDFVQYGRCFARLGEPWTKIYMIAQHSLSVENQESEDEHEETEELVVALNFSRHTHDHTLLTKLAPGQHVWRQAGKYCAASFQASNSR